MRRIEPNLRGPHLIAGLLTLLLAVLGAAGCADERDRAPEGLTRSEFIEVVVALRNAEIELEAPDSVYEARFRTRRDSILDAHGTTQRALYEFLNRHPDLQYMDAVWDTITQRTIRESDDPRSGPTPVR